MNKKNWGENVTIQTLKKTTVCAKNISNSFTWYNWTEYIVQIVLN